MKLLAIDTATEACSAALWLDGRIDERFEIVGRGHTERLLPMVAELLAGAGLRVPQLDGIVCGIGPGSFAGVRIGVGYVKGLALAADLPVLGTSSLAMLALQGLRAGDAGVIAAIDARMNEVYAGVFARGADQLPQGVRPEWVGSPAALEPLTGNWSGMGSGWRAYPAELRGAVGAPVEPVRGDALPRAADALALALPCFRAGQFIDADALAPQYLRNKVALTLEEQAQKRRDARDAG